MIRIEKIIVELLPDEIESYPDHLGTFSDKRAAKFSIDRGEDATARHEFRYFNADNVENMKQARENYARVMEFENGSVSLLGIKAEARIATSDNGREWLLNTISSGGLWGIESDSDILESILAHNKRKAKGVQMYQFLRGEQP